MLAQLLHGQALLLAFTDHVSGQEFLSRTILAGHHHRLLHSFTLAQRRFDLPQLNAEAPHLHLMIQPPQKFQVPVFHVPHTVPGAVQPLSTRPISPSLERIGHELLRRQLRTIQIPPRQSRPSDVQLSRHSHRYRLHPFIQHIQSRIRDRLPDGHKLLPPLPPALPPAHIDRRLRRPVQVVQLRSQPLLKLPLQLRSQRFSAAYHPPQAPAPLQPSPFQPRAQHRRHKVHGRDSVSLHRLDQILPLLLSSRSRHHQSRSCQQRPEKLPHRHIKRVRRLLQHPVLFPQLIALLHPQQPVPQSAVHVHGSLGPARRSRRVDHIHHSLRLALVLRIVSPLLSNLRPLPIHTDHLRSNCLRQSPQQPLLAEHHPRLRIPEHVAEPLLRIIRIHGHIGSPGLHHSQ